jgi:putative resolvase
MRGYPPMTRRLTWIGKSPACRRERCRPACPWSGVEAEVEVGSEMNGTRVKTRRLLADPAATVVAVEHRDQLGRTNTELAEAALAAYGRRLVVLDDCEVTDDLLRDMIEVLTSFCARLYGRRLARNRALKAIGCAQRDIGLQAAPKAASARCGGAG